MEPLDPAQLRLHAISDPRDPRIGEVAALDEALFGPHFSLDEGALRDLVSGGGLLFVHQEPGGRVVTEASLVTAPNPAAPSRLERHLPAWLGYCDGSAVSPAYRGRGLQRHLLQARESAAAARGMRGLCASVRSGNVASIRAMLGCGFVLAVDAPYYFGPRPQDARVVMLKLLGEDAAACDPATPADATAPCPSDAVSGRVSAGVAHLALEVRQTDHVPRDLDAAMARLLRAGYLGVGCRDLARPGDERVSALLFTHGLRIPGTAGQRLRAAQAEIQSLVDGAGPR